MKRTLLAGGALLLAISAFAQTSEIFTYRDNPDKEYTWANNYQSNRFVIRYSENKSDSSYITQKQAEDALAELERVYDIIVHKMGFHPAHTLGSDFKPKIEVIVARSSGYAWADGGKGYGGTLGEPKAPALWVTPRTIKRKETLVHELMHGLQEMAGGLQNSDYVSWFHESHANLMTYQVYYNKIDKCTEKYIQQRHLRLDNAENRYCNWLFFEYLIDTKGMQFINELWTKSYKSDNPENQQNADPFSELMRIHGISQREFGDIIGDFAMRNVVYDFKRKALFRKTYKNTNTATPAEFPQRYGFNIIRIYPNKQGTVTVRFKGNSEHPNADWRYGLVAVKGSNARYSEIKRASDGNPDVSMQLKKGETEMYLVVAATPTVHYKIKQNEEDSAVPRYPFNFLY